MLFTCDACSYTFTDSTLPDSCPDSCPDCGKRTVKSKTNKFITVPAVRPATEAETTWYNEIQAELKEEEEQLMASG